MGRGMSAAKRTAAPEPRFVVPDFARTFSLAQLPLQPPTRTTLQRMGLRTLGDVHELPWSRFYGQVDHGERIADLAVTIARVRDRKVVPTDHPSSGPPRGLLEALDGALAEIEPVRRDVLLLRFGGDGSAPLTNGHVADRLGLGSRQNVEQVQVTALKHLRRAGGPELVRMLRGLEEKATEGAESVEEALKRELATATGHKLAAAFYLRVLWALAPGLRGRRCTLDAGSASGSEAARSAMTSRRLPSPSSSR